jgi:CRISPR system Cascade subunit CasE
MTDAPHFTRLTLKHDDAAIDPILSELAPPDTGLAMSVAHRLLWTVMPSDVRARFDRASPVHPAGSAFLWREAEAGRKFYLLGPRPAETSPFFDVETKPYTPAFATGDRLSFDLRVNATVSRPGAPGERGRSKRCDVAMDLLRKQEADAPSAPGLGPRGKRRMAAAEAAARRWLDERAERHGFAVKAMRLSAYRAMMLPRRAAPARIGVFDLDGVIEVADGERLLRCVLSGLGHAKAFGCGLLLLRRA